MSSRNSIRTVLIMNKDDAISTISNDKLVFKDVFDQHHYVVSDVDEELIILIEFDGVIELNSVIIHAFSIIDDEIDASPPKHVNIYRIENMSKTFDDIKQMKSNKRLSCSLSKLEHGQIIKLKTNPKNAVAFDKIKYLAIFIESNQNESEVTNINGIQFKTTKEMKQRKAIKELTKTNKDKIASLSSNEINCKHMKDLTLISKYYECSVDPEDEKEPQHQCICGQYLNTIYPNTLLLLDMSKYTCDICRLIVEKQEIFWHCPSTNYHTYGFDVCSKCISTFEARIYLSVRFPLTGPVIDCSDLLVGKIPQHFCDVRVSNCQSFNRLKGLLERYHSVEDFIDHKSNNDYDETILSNHFQHLLNNHDHEFQVIYDHLKRIEVDKSCNLSNCHSILRNHRDRTSEENCKTLYSKPFKTTDFQDISKIQLLDKIHCYYLHSIDTGLKLSNINKEWLLN
eukprot:334066_1